MFCPNCGKDCGSAKFCPECGQKLQGKFEQEQKSPVWSVGMSCPHCGGTRLDGNSCAFCGAQLMVDISNTADSTEDVYFLPKLGAGSSSGRSCSIELNEDSFAFRMIKSFKADLVYLVPYSQIGSITYYHDFRNSELIIEDKSIPKQVFHIAPRDKVGLVYQLFCYLKTVVSDSARIIVNDKCIDDALSEKYFIPFDTDAFFNAYNPYQLRACKKVQEIAGINSVEAYTVVAKIFRKRQDTLYAGNPALAIRDLNRVIREKEREHEESEREREERRKNIRSHRR